MAKFGYLKYVEDGEKIPDWIARQFPEQFAHLDWKEGHIGKLDLRPTSGFSKKIQEQKEHQNQLDNLSAVQSRKAQDKSFQRKYYPAEAIPAFKLDNLRKEARWQARLGIVGNNLAIPKQDFKKRHNSSSLNSPKIGRKKDYETQRAVQKYKLAYKNVHQCGNWCHSQLVDIKKSNKHGSCSTTGVKTCGSVWCCAVCRRKILNRRAKALKKMARYWKRERRGELAMITFTVPHNAGESLAQVYGSSTKGVGLAGAMSNFRAKRAFARDFKDSIGYQGDVRTVEVTHGKNGWHCHIHMLVFFENKIPYKYWEKKLLKSWQASCVKCGLRKPNERGLDIEYINHREAGDFSAYLAKWGAPSEVSSQFAKGAKNGNMTIAELEQCLTDDFTRSWKGMDLKTVCKTLSIYYRTMKGQKMMQLGGISKNNNWRADLIEEMEASDAQLLGFEIEEHSESVALISAESYHKIAKRGLVWRLIDFAEKGGFEGVENFFIEQNIDIKYVQEPEDWHLKKIMARLLVQLWDRYV